ncbi:protein kinase domain-containing protein [Candidatus Leptofilum sp.]|uniref:protein kinase domain-containing protein n=1 Tax=Candidatus Leptofilum sp. TaxID=3241576 RepID=UPI003B5B586B
MTLQTFGRYKISHLIGQGGMAEVYAAEDPKLDRLVALKIILKRFSEAPRFQARFLNEAQTIAGLEHRAILPVYDFGQDESTQNLYLVMRLMPDVLHDRLEREKFIPLADASLILNRLAVALNRAHSEGIVHRDIKPANILLDEEGTVFLADFGLAAPLDKMEAGIVPQSYGGSPFYMAPEQWRGETAQPYTDIYQLGVTLFKMITGELPFPNPDRRVLVEQHLNGRIPNACELNPKLPPKIQPILEKAMAKAPAERYKTVLELADEVANLLRPKLIKRRYEIKEELQHGRFATVYQAQDLIDEQLIALKILKQPLMPNHKYQKEFVRQRAELLRLPAHPAIVPVYEVDLHEEKPFVAMKFVDGPSLRTRFRKEGRLSVNQVCEIAKSLADGLDALHENEQVHGDIHMGNVLIGSNNECLLTDFQITAVTELTTLMMEEEAPLGYLACLAPEQWARGSLVPQTDIYQFGMLLFELLTGQRLFTQTDLLELEEAIAKEPLPPITSLAPELPTQFDAIFAKALAKRPEVRYASAGELVQMLSEAWQSHAFDSSVHEGVIQYEAKQWDAAIEAYKQALKIKPDSGAVADALSRAERRQQDEVVLNQCREAMANERWRDADYFLSQASDSPEKKALQEQVQRKIQVEQWYSEGKVAMQQQDWLKAQKLLDEADSLEPNYLDINALLGELAEKIEAHLQQAREAIAQSEHDKALILLKPVAEHETAVALRHLIDEKRKPVPIMPVNDTRSRRNWFGWGAVGLLSIVVAVFFILNGRLTDEEKLACLQTAVPELHINRPGEPELVLPQNTSATISSKWLELGLSVEWTPDELSNACQQFIANDSSIESSWSSDAGEIEKQGRWEVAYLLSSSSAKTDRIVVTLLYDGQPLTNVFLLHFQP